MPSESRNFVKALETEKNTDVHDIIVIALLTSARKSDVFSMRWCDLTLTGNAAWKIPNPKTTGIVPKPYVVHLAPRVIDVLRRRARNAGDNPWVFPATPQSGHVEQIDKPWAEFRKRAKLRDFVFHDLRRSQPSRLVSRGYSMKLASEILGHSSVINTEKHYAHLLPSATAEAVDSFANEIFASEQ